MNRNSKGQGAEESAGTDSTPFEAISDPHSSGCHLPHDGNCMNIITRPESSFLSAARTRRAPHRLEHIMTTTLAATDRPDPVGNGHPEVVVRRAFGLVRRILVAFALILSFTGLAALAAAPAQAATTTQTAVPAHGTITACFQAPITQYGRVYWGPYNRPVLLDVSLYGRPYQMNWYDTPGLNGCESVDVPAGYYWRLRVNHTEARTRWVGQSRWQYVNSGYSYNLGTVRVSTVRV